MFKSLKYLIDREKDSRGVLVSEAIKSISAKTETSVFSWSYLKDQDVYENTITGSRYYTYELHSV